MKHKHHIVPRHAGGSDDETNLVELTVTQHAMWHFAEWQLNQKWEDKAAWQVLANNVVNPLHVKGRKLTEEQKKEISDRMKGNTHGSVPCSPEKREKISEALKGIKRSEETKEKLRQINTGRKHTDEAKKKCSEAGKKARGVSKPKGRTPTNAKGVEVDGVRYSSALAASKELNICVSTVLRRCKSDKHSTYILL